MEVGPPTGSVAFTVTASRRFQLPKPSSPTLPDIHSAARALPQEWRAVALQGQSILRVQRGPAETNPSSGNSTTTNTAVPFNISVVLAEFNEISFWVHFSLLISHRLDSRKNQTHAPHGWPALQDEQKSSPTREMLIIPTTSRKHGKGFSVFRDLVWRDLNDGSVAEGTDWLVSWLAQQTTISKRSKSRLYIQSYLEEKDRTNRTRQLWPPSYLKAICTNLTPQE